MNILHYLEAQKLTMHGYGTSEGVKKEWESRPRKGEGGATPAGKPSEDEVHEAFRKIVKNQHEPALNYAVNYAKAGLNHPDKGGPMTGDELRVQALYTLGNISRWRGEDGKSVRDTLKRFTKK
jgi:hypothetical protein